MKSKHHKDYPEVNAECVLQTTTFKNVAPEFVERVAETIKRLSDILYVSVTREMNLKYEREV